MTFEERRAMYLKYTYGITAEQYEGMLASQDGYCAICRQPPKGDRPLAVDHCHRSGRVRALLCVSCNRFLGGYEAFRERAEEFLSQYGQGNPLVYGQDS
jgi:hypothetical protein